jgi:hypothetical protein
MANEHEDEGGKALSMAEIAATLVASQPPVDAAPTSGDSDVEDEEELEVAEATDEGDDEATEQPVEAPADEPEDFDVSDDDVLTVVVDGEEREVTIGELKKAHSLGGATEKRLQEATELRKTAHAERTQMLEKLAEEERTLAEALSSLDEQVFKPVIPAPNEAMKRTNPEQYLRHRDAYDADQKRIADAKKAVQDRINTIAKTRQDRLKAYADDAGKMLLSEIPEFRDPTKATDMLHRMTTTAKAYGYTDQEIQSALDPRMFMLVRDAMRYREMTDPSRERRSPTNLEDQKVKKIRRLRTGNTTAKNRARVVDQQHKAVVAKARSSGKVADIAATLVVPKG